MEVFVVHFFTCAMSLSSRHPVRPTIRFVKAISRILKEGRGGGQGVVSVKVGVRYARTQIMIKRLVSSLRVRVVLPLVWLASRP